MTKRSPFHAAIAGLTVAAIVANPITAVAAPNAPAAADEAENALTHTVPTPGWVTVDPKPAGTASTFTATVLPYVTGEVLFVVTTKAPEGQAGEEVFRQQAPITEGKAVFNHAFANAGEYVVQATIVREGKAGIPSAPYAFTVAQNELPSGTSISGNITAGDLAGPIVGAVVSLAVLIGSQSHIPALEQMITDTQKALGIYNPQLVASFDNALPVVGGVIGVAGLAGSIAGLVKALKDSGVEITIEKNNA